MQHLRHICIKHTNKDHTFSDLLYNFFERLEGQKPSPTILGTKMEPPSSHETPPRPLPLGKNKNAPALPSLIYGRSLSR